MTYGIFNSPKKTKKFNFTTMVSQVELFLFFLWENWRHQKDVSKLNDLYKSILLLESISPQEILLPPDQGNGNVSRAW